jgi:hypothetical protein
VAFPDREVDSMSCGEFESDLVDRARGAQLAVDRAAALHRHLRDCVRCAARFDREQALSAALRRLAEDTVVPPIDRVAEQRLLAAFDGQRRMPSPRRVTRFAAAAAVLLAAAATLVWMVAARDRRVDPRVATAQTRATTETPSVPRVIEAKAHEPSVVVKRGRTRRAAPTRPRADDTRFVMLPGVDDLPPFESGQLMRVQLPASVVASLGLRPPRPLGADGVVQTDVLVGQDGYARAVRLVQ